MQWSISERIDGVSGPRYLLLLLMFQTWSPPLPPCLASACDGALATLINLRWTDIYFPITNPATEKHRIMAEFSTGSSRQQAICGVFVYPRHRFYPGHVSHLSNWVVERGSVSSGQSLIILLDKHYPVFFSNVQNKSLKWIYNSMVINGDNWSNLD